MDMEPSTITRIILHYEDCRSLEMRPDKVMCQGSEKQKIVSAIKLIEAVCVHQATAADLSKTAP